MTDKRAARKQDLFSLVGLSHYSRVEIWNQRVPTELLYTNLGNNEIENMRQ